MNHKDPIDQLLDAIFPDSPESRKSSEETEQEPPAVESKPAVPEPDPSTRAEYPGELTTEDVQASLSRNKAGRVMQTMFNCQTALNLDPVIGGKLRRNQMTGMIDLVGEVLWNRGPGISLTDMDVHEIESRFELSYGLSPGKKMQNTIDLVANQNRYHPVVERLESFTWDGQPRVRRCCIISWERSKASLRKR